MILIAGATYDGKHLGAYGRHTSAILVSVATTTFLWRICTFRAGELMPAAIVAAPDPGRLVRGALIAHLFMVVGIMATSAGYELDIEHPLGRTDPDWLTFILGGSALFIVGRVIFEHTLFARVSIHRVIGVLVLIALAPVMVFVPPLAVATTAMAILAAIAIAIAIADAVAVRRHPPNVPSASAGRS